MIEITHPKHILYRTSPVGIWKHTLILITYEAKLILEQRYAALIYHMDTTQLYIIYQAIGILYTAIGGHQQKGQEAP